MEFDKRIWSSWEVGKDRNEAESAVVRAQQPTPTGYSDLSSAVNRASSGEWVCMVFVIGQGTTV